MAVTREEILEALKEMSLLEASELVKDIEETFGVSAAAPVAVAAAPAAGGDAAAAGGDDKSEFDVVLEGFGDNKIGVIKAIRDITGLGLKEAKEMVEGAPATVQEGVAKDAAEEMKAKIEEAGGACTLK
ncbi:MAG: 50S ribosomal protein L7/L12 [Eggerthellaceae bacterium]|nr:50S ribosomal protein L7/L12 [Eggerthellaceae bacterium]